MPAMRAMLLLLLGVVAGTSAGPGGASPYSPASCPPASNYTGRREVVLGWARQMLNGSFNAGPHYGPRAFLRDTNTFVAVALDYSPVEDIRPFLLGLFVGQRPNGDVGTCCVVYNATTRKPLPLHEQGSSPNVGEMTKADATTDAEASLVSTLYKYVHHAGDTSILQENVASYYDPVNRTVQERLGMLLGYLGNSSGRFHDQVRPAVEEAPPSLQTSGELPPATRDLSVEEAPISQR